SIPTADYARRYPALPRKAVRNADGAYWVLPTVDGFVRCLPGSPRQWQGFVELVGSEVLAGPGWSSALHRLMNAAAVRRPAPEALAPRRRADLLAQARALDVPLVPLNRPEEFIDEEQTRLRGYFRRTGFPHVGDAPFAAPPFGFEATPATLRQPAPSLGATGPVGFVPRAPEPAGGGDGPVLAGLHVVDLGVGGARPRGGYLL